VAGRREEMREGIKLRVRISAHPRLIAGFDAIFRVRTGADWIELRRVKDERAES